MQNCFHLFWLRWVVLDSELEEVKLLSFILVSHIIFGLFQLQSCFKREALSGQEVFTTFNQKRNLKSVKLGMLTINPLIVE